MSPSEFKCRSMAAMYYAAIDGCSWNTFSLRSGNAGTQYYAHMRITDDAAKEFSALYAEEFGEQLSIPEARELASNFCELYELLLSPTPREQQEREEKEQQEATLTQVADQSPDGHPQ